MTPETVDPERFSRWMAYVLRHNPQRYDLVPDRHGYVELEAFVQIAQRRYREADAKAVRQLVVASHPDRFEVASDRLRARYGHSIPVEPVGTPVEPPPTLYHGTEPSRADVILAEGLHPEGRVMVHLSQTVDDAVSVARRRTETPAVLTVQAREASRDGCAFYQEGRVYLVASVPPRFLSRGPSGG